MNVCILGASRTGTTLLAESLRTHPAATVRGEIFGEGGEGLATQGGLIKLLHHQPHAEHGVSFDEALTELIGRNFKFILMLRDYFDRELSHLIATQEDNWQGSAYSTQLSVPEDFHGHLSYISERNRLLLDRMAGHPPLILNYSDLVNLWPTVTRNVQKFMGLDPVPLKQATKRQMRGASWGSHYVNLPWAREEHAKMRATLLTRETSPELLAGPHG